MEFENIHEIHIFCFLIKKRHFLIRKKQKVYIFHIFFQIATFLNTGVYIYVCVCIYIYVFENRYIYIIYMCLSWRVLFTCGAKQLLTDKKRSNYNITSLNCFEKAWNLLVLTHQVHGTLTN